MAEELFMLLSHILRTGRPAILVIATQLAAVLWMSLAAAAASAEEKPAPTTPTAPAMKAVKALIAQLGSAEFAERKAASDKLQIMGLAVIVPLEEATTHPDREVRFRAERLLGSIKELDLQRRLEAFLSGKEDAGEYALPAWGKFKNLFGDDHTSRELFVEMQRADAELLAALEKNSRTAMEELAIRVQQQEQALRQQSGKLSLGQVATMLFVAGDDEAPLPTQTAASVLGFCHQQSLRDAVTNDKFEKIPRKLLAGVIRRSDDWAAYNAMMIAYQHNMEEGLIPAVKILNMQANRQPHMTQYALMTIAKLGDKSHLPLVESLLSDKAVLQSIQQNKIRYEVQVRDAALATSVLLTKQKLSDYFSTPPDKVSDPQQAFIIIRALAFSSEA
jgi:hypothetical protein